MRFHYTLYTISIQLFTSSEEHKRHQPKCAFLKIKDPYAITVGQVLDLEKAAMENFIVRVGRPACSLTLSMLYCLEHGSVETGERSESLCC